MSGCLQRWFHLPGSEAAHRALQVVPLDVARWGDGRGDPDGLQEKRLLLFIPFLPLPCTTGTLKSTCSQFFVELLLASGGSNMYRCYLVLGIW